MTTETMPAPTERLPWEVEPETDGGVIAQVFLRPETTIATFDRPADAGTYRVVGVRVGALTMHIVDFHDGDAEIIAAIEPLVNALLILCNSAHARLRAAADAAETPA